MWNSIPTQNGQNADLVLGRPNFTTFVEPDISKVAVSATATSMLNPVSVTSDGTRLYVTDLGHNRVLVWNSIPTQNGQPADIALGQPDVASTDTISASDPNNSHYLCPSNGTDSTTNQPTYPYACAATLSFPRSRYRMESAYSLRTVETTAFWFTTAFRRGAASLQTRYSAS